MYMQHFSTRNSKNFLEISWKIFKIFTIFINVLNLFNLIENIGYGDLISDDISKQLQKIKNDAIRYKRKLEKGEFEIAIVGLEKAGKSTFANAPKQFPAP